MKRRISTLKVTLFFALFNLFIGSSVFAQVPEKMSYQAVVRDASNQLVISQSVGMQISILQGSASGTEVYVETQTPTTNANGLVTVEIGSGTVVSGDLTTIDWANGPYFIKTEIDPAGGTNYTITGTSQLLSVPYALYAKTAGESQTTWNLTGNSGTANGTDFIGTTDAQDLDIRTNNIVRVRITQKGQIEVINSGNSVFIGEGAGANDDFSDNKNTFVGYQSGYANTNGQYNTAVGSQTLYSNSAGYANTAVGISALYSNTTGRYNTANGLQALYYNTEGKQNTATGLQALYQNTTGDNNTADGFQALFYNTTGENNTANGFSALYNNNTGSYNTATGVGALYTNTTGYSNVAIGVNALYRNTDRNNLVAIGDSALFNNGTGVSGPYDAEGNTAVGSKTLYSNTTGYDNTAIGSQALYSNNVGRENVAVGYQVLYTNTSGIYNTAAGNQALYYNTTGENNTAVGYRSLYFNATGSYNTANGYRALRCNTEGDLNTASGSLALYHNTTGDNNTAMGYDALFTTSTGAYNTALGSKALYANSTGNQNTAVGYNAFFYGSSYSNSTALGYNADISASNQVRIGNSDVTSIGGFADWTNVSDKRFKKDVQENVPGLDFVMKLRPVTYHLDMNAIAKFLNTPDSLRLKDAEAIKGSLLQTGFIAQEVEEAAKSLGYEFSGVDAPKNPNDYYGLRYAEFVVPLVKATQELYKKMEAENKSLKERIEEQQKQIDRLEEIINSMQSK